MGKWRRRTVYYLVSLVFIVFAYAVAYHRGMMVYENEFQRFLHSLQVVVETFTTTGYGSDAPWESAEMNLFIILMDITGVALIFIALPVLVFPLFEEMLSTNVPTSLDETVSDHVIICSYTPRGETLIAELDSWGVDYVIIELDRDRATDLYETGYSVVHADPESVSGLEGARLPDARAIVTDVSDRVNVSIVLTAKEVAESVQAICVAEEPGRSAHHRFAGADEVLSPRQLLGTSLATKVTTAVTTDLGETIEIGEDFEIIELPIHRGSELVGRTLAESGIREQTGMNVIGAWSHGEFESPPAPDTVLDGGTILLTSGREPQLETLKQLTLTDMRRFDRGETILVGYGEVGEQVSNVLDDAGVPYTVVDHIEKNGVDVVGDATAQFTTLVIRDLNPEIEIIARSEESETMAKMYRAGADYVLSLATVCGRMLASTILEDEDVISPDTQVHVIRTHAPQLDGQTIGDARVRTRTGCTVVGVERNGAIITDVGPDFRVRSGDELLIAGTDDGTNRFTELMC